jgi:hypothetical protein
MSPADVRFLHAAGIAPNRTSRGRRVIGARQSGRRIPAVRDPAIARESFEDTPVGALCGLGLALAVGAALWLVLVLLLVRDCWARAASAAPSSRPDTSSCAS